MNFAWLAVFLALAPVLPAVATPGPVTDPEGLRFYSQGNYQAAVQLYRQALRGDPRNADLHYNLGNALFKSGQTGRAISSFQRAFDIRPRDADIRQNLDFALRRAGEELAPTGVPPLLFFTFHLLSERELAALHWLACWLLLVLAGLYLWKESLRPRLLSGTLAAGVLWSAFGAWWLAVRSGVSQQRGVIVATSAEIRSGPGENFNVSFTAPEGRRLQIFSQEGDWLEIGVLKEGIKGWIPAAAIDPI